MVPDDYLRHQCNRNSQHQQRLSQRGQSNFGPFITGKLGRDFEFDLAAGGTLVETNPSVPPSYYYSLIFRYQLTHHTQLVFSGSHDLIFTTATDLTEENLFRLGAQFKLTRLITLSLSPFVNFGTVKTTTVGNVDTGDYTLFGIEVGVDWRIRKRWSPALLMITFAGSPEQPSEPAPQPQTITSKTPGRLPLTIRFKHFQIAGRRFSQERDSAFWVNLAGQELLTKTLSCSGQDVEFEKIPEGVQTVL